MQPSKFDINAIKAIASKKYNHETINGVAVNYCNYFVDDMLQQNFSVKLPRLYDVKPSYQESLPGWPDAPAGPIHGDLDVYLKNRSTLPYSGVELIENKEEARQLANEGHPVVAADWMHTTLVAPSKKKWLQVYRQDQAGRTDYRTKVGVKPDTTLKFYLIKPNEYNIFDEAIQETGATHKDIRMLDFYLEQEETGFDIYGNEKARLEKLRQRVLFKNKYPMF